MSSAEELDETLASVPTETLDATESSEPLIATENDNSDMAAVSKELDPELTKPSADEGIFSIIYSAVKKVAVVGAIYLVGYMGWSVAWLIAPVILSVVRDQYRLTTAKKRNIAKASALASEKDVILARIDELPAWVYFPDVERCEWVNKILKQVWPNANYFARTLVKETIEPSVAQALERYKMSGFRFDRIILGTIPPRIGGVKVYDKNVNRNEIIMDLDLFYASDCDINFYLGGMKGGIKDFQIHGWVRVVMKPLIRSMPLVGGLQIFFLNNPNIDFNLVGVIDLLDVPGLSDLLRRIIVEQIGAIMVLPNKLPITLSNEVPAVALKMPEPEGILRIHVVEAKDLMKKDIGMLGKGKSDPYAVINVGAQEFRTQTIDNTVNPKWDYWCEAKISWHLSQTVDFKLWDFDPGVRAAHDALGRASVEIASVVKKGVLDTWLTLDQAKHGLLHVRLTWYTLTSDPQDLQAALRETQMLRVTSMSTALLIVFIDSAKNLPHPRQVSNPDPYLVVSLGKQNEQTGVQLRDDSPVWEQGFTFLVTNPDHDTLQLKLVDQKTSNELGRFSYPLNTLMTTQNMAVVSQPFQLEKSGPESKIIMSLALKILKRADCIDDTALIDGVLVPEGSNLSRTSSVRTASQVEGAIISNKSKDMPLSPQESSISEEESIQSSMISISSCPPAPPRSPNQRLESSLTHRFPDITNSAGEHGRGRIQLSVRYSVTRQRLTVTVHKIMNIPMSDPSNIPDPYVKLYLLPGRAKESKRKTITVRDSCNPIYDATFEYVISSAELLQTELEVTVATQKGFLSGGSPVIGMLKISLAEKDISGQGLSAWFDLEPEMKND